MLMGKISFGPWNFSCSTSSGHREQLVCLHISSPVFRNNTLVITVNSVHVVVRFLLFFCTQSDHTRFEKRGTTCLQMQRNCTINRNLCGSCFLGLRPFCMRPVSARSAAKPHDMRSAGFLFLKPPPPFKASHFLSHRKSQPCVYGARMLFT